MENKLTTISRRVKVDQSASSKNFDITYSYQHEVDQAPDMITAKAVSKKEGDVKLKVDLTWYPKTQNLNITCHNTPANFSGAMIDEIVSPINEIMTEFN